MRLHELEAGKKYLDFDDREFVFVGLAPISTLEGAADYGGKRGLCIIGNDAGPFKAVPTRRKIYVAMFKGGGCTTESDIDSFRSYLSDIGAGAVEATAAFEITVGQFLEGTQP
jgi:hypothetical protein